MAGAVLALPPNSAYGGDPACTASPHVHAATARPSSPVSLFALYRLCFVVGLFSFGGGLSAWMRREVVLVRGWMTDEEFFNGYSLAQILPGVNSTNMAVYIGQHLRGAVGAAVALTGLLIGSVLDRDRRRRGLPLSGRDPGLSDRHGRARGRRRRHDVPSRRNLDAQRAPASCRRCWCWSRPSSPSACMQWPLVPVLVVLAPPQHRRVLATKAARCVTTR